MKSWTVFKGGARDIIAADKLAMLMGALVFSTGGVISAVFAADRWDRCILAEAAA
jgi:hypothetical protein